MKFKRRRKPTEMEKKLIATLRKKDALIRALRGEAMKAALMHREIGKKLESAHWEWVLAEERRRFTEQVERESEWS